GGVPASAAGNPAGHLSAHQQVKQGVDRYQAGDYKGAIAYWQTALQSFQHHHHRREQAIVLSNLARAQQQLGQSQTAIGLWEQVIQHQRQLGNPTEVGRALTEQAQAYSRIGQQRKAIALLCNANLAGKCTDGSALKIAEQNKDAIVEVAALGALGNAYRLMGDHQLAEKNLRASLQLGQALAPLSYRISALNSLGMLYSNLAQVQYQNAAIAEQGGDTAEEVPTLLQAAKNWEQKAINVLQQSLQLAHQANHPTEELRSLLTLIPLYGQSNPTLQTTTWQQANQLLATLPDSRERVFAMLNLVQIGQASSPQSGASQADATLARNRCLGRDRLTQAEPLLQTAVAIARRIEDSRAESFALGELAQVYECRQAFEQALEWSKQARLAADQKLDAKDSLYLWEWQTGRILRQQWAIQGQAQPELLQAAIASYEQAIQTLESIRSDILTANRDLQFDFRDTIDPIYRELVALKLGQKLPTQAGAQVLTTPTRPAETSRESSAGEFQSILRTIDNLKLAELQNYFGNDCVITALNPNAVDLDPSNNTAIFNTIVLENQTAVIVSFPNQQQKFYRINVPRQTVINQINQFRIGLEDARFNYDPKLAQQVYDWIIRPFENDLQNSQVKTLVFVQDGIFRTVPMAALHDGKQFLIQRYAIANAPSLQLIDPQPLQRNQLRILALGLSKAATVAGRGFPPLPNVVQELAGILQIIPGSRTLLDEEFTRDRLQQELSQTVYPIIHLATHGKFATNPEETFIITGDRQKLTFNELDQLIRRVSRNPEPLELLSLTACETAVGNDRAALGLAGVAVQAGARSALASLWAVDDAVAAKLSTEFYSRLQNPEFSKAAALQQLQKGLIEGTIALEGFTANHPAYWSPFVLIGNWL
ncbi:MAG: CHAT domain-containing protein, partial [Synechococcales bacterium]|nr:CHAT domain-containing protein [Synechococcales bacterium]